MKSVQEMPGYQYLRKSTETGVDFDSLCQCYSPLIPNNIVTQTIEQQQPKQKIRSMTTHTTTAQRSLLLPKCP